MQWRANVRNWRFRHFLSLWYKMNRQMNGAYFRLDCKEGKLWIDYMNPQWGIFARKNLQMFGILFVCSWSKLMTPTDSRFCHVSWFEVTNSREYFNEIADRMEPMDSTKRLTFEETMRWVAMLNIGYDLNDVESSFSSYTFKTHHENCPKCHKIS